MHDFFAVLFVYLLGAGILGAVWSGAFVLFHNEVLPRLRGYRYEDGFTDASFRRGWHKEWLK